MPAKLAFLILALGVIGAALLSLRQARLQGASEVAQARLRIRAADDELFALRAQIAARVTPASIEAMAASAGPLRPATNDAYTLDAFGQLVEALEQLPQTSGASPGQAPMALPVGNPNAVTPPRPARGPLSPRPAAERGRMAGAAQ